MVITATEAKINFGKYLSLSRKEDILITKNGSIIARLTKPVIDQDALLDSLVGIVPAGLGDVDIKEERLSRQ